MSAAELGEVKLLFPTSDAVWRFLLYTNAAGVSVQYKTVTGQLTGNDIMIACTKFKAELILLPKNTDK